MPPYGPGGVKISGAQYRRLRREQGKSEGSQGNPEVRLARNRVLSKDRAKEMRKVLQAFKVEKGCADCGYKAHHFGLEFDHLPGQPKVSGVMAMAGRNGRDALWLEVQKCDVVCATCHNIRTWKRKHPEEG